MPEPSRGVPRSRHHDRAGAPVAVARRPPLYSADALNRRTDIDPRLSSLLRAIPVAALIGFAWAIAWDTTGSIRAADWLPYALAAALVLAAVLLAGAAYLPDRLPLVAAGCLTAFAVWTAVSAAWSPLPSLARDDGLLALFYAIAFLTPLVTLRSAADRLAAIAVAVIGLTTLMLWTAVRLRTGGEPDVLYSAGRLDFPVTYWNGQSAIALAALLAGYRARGRPQAPPGIARRRARRRDVDARSLDRDAEQGRRRRAGRVRRRRVRGLERAPAAARSLRYRVRARGVRRRRDDEALPRRRRSVQPGRPARRHDDTRRRGDRRRTRARICARRPASRAVARRCAGLPASPSPRSPSSSHSQVSGSSSPRSTIRSARRKRAGTTSSTSTETAPGRATSAQLGSNRYDFWRVALDEFAHHPFAGIGGRGWDVAYRAHGRSEERTGARALARARRPERDRADRRPARGNGGRVGSRRRRGARTPLAALCGSARHGRLLRRPHRR